MFSTMVTVYDQLLGWSFSLPTVSLCQDAFAAYPRMLRYPTVILTLLPLASQKQENL